MDISCFITFSYAVWLDGTAAVVSEYSHICISLSGAGVHVLVMVSWWGAGVVICLERGADLHMAQLMPLPLTVSCFCKIQIGFTLLVPAHTGSPGKRAVKWVCVSMC